MQEEITRWDQESLLETHVDMHVHVKDDLCVDTLSMDRQWTTEGSEVRIRNKTKVLSYSLFITGVLNTPLIRCVRTDNGNVVVLEEQGIVVIEIY